VLLLLVPALGPGLIAQNPTGTAGSAPASDIAAPNTGPRTIHVDAIVTDKQGKPIVNLKPADFEVLENGVAQKIEAIELKSRASASSSKDAIETADDEERAAKEPGTRVIALYLDEFHVSAGASTERVRAAAATFVDTQVRPGDLLIVMKPLDHVTNIRFTRDRTSARTAIERFSGRKGDYTPRTPFEEQYLGHSPGSVRQARAQIVMSGLRAVASRMGELDGGLAAIVLISEGFTTDVPRSRERRLPDLQGFVRAASRQQVMLYSFDPGGTDVSVDAAATDPDPNMAPLASLAQQTGGEALEAGQDLALALQRVSRDLDTYYVLTYTSASASDGRFNALEIKARRRDAQVRARSGYWTPLPVVFTASRSMPPPLTPMRPLRRSPLINSWLGSTIEPDGQRRVIFTWTPSAVPLRNKPGARPAVVALKATTLSGSVLFEGDVTAVRTGAITRQRADSAVFQTGPGRVQLDLTIFQADGTKLDFAAQDFDVPVLGKSGPVILAPQLFRAASAREFREISVDPAAAPVPGREFRRTEHLLLRIPAYDTSGNTVQISAKLMNRVGTVLLDLTKVAGDGSIALTQFEVPLARFAPGDYSIEVAATSDTGNARELIQFRVTG
jgi:VWFA-related protein